MDLAGDLTFGHDYGNIEKGKLRESERNGIF